MIREIVKTSTIDDHHDNAEITISTREEIIQLNTSVAEKEKIIESNEKELKLFKRKYSNSLENIKTLKKQKMTLSHLVNNLEVQRLKQNVCHMATVNKDEAKIGGVNHIPVDHLLPPRESSRIVVGSGSYGVCELMRWKNIDVCVKTFHPITDISEVKKEASILHELQQSLFVPVLLGINLMSPPFYIVTKFHSLKPESSVILYKAINSSTVIELHKWIKILIKCGTAIKSIHDLGFIHNDLHQGNRIIDKMYGHTHPIVIDFGKACKTGEGRCRTLKNQKDHLVKHPWIAPETISGEAKESEASDIYGFGYIMSEVNCKLACESLQELAKNCQSKRVTRPSINNVIASLQNII
jgi:serine/threonine protein kinase